RPWCPTRFRGLTATASLKLIGVNPHPRPRCRFRGLTATASLKPRPVVWDRLETDGIPWPHSHGLIEAAHRATLHRYRFSRFRGLTATASLKRVWTSHRRRKYSGFRGLTATASLKPTACSQA